MQATIRPRAITFLAALASSALFFVVTSAAEPVTVRYAEGVMHGFLELQTLEGKNIAWGEMTQFAQGDRVTTRLVFSFTDRSLYDETTVFTQRGTFLLVSDHLIQK